MPTAAPFATVTPIARPALAQMSELAAALAGLNSLLHDNATAAADRDSLAPALGAYHAGAVHHAAELLALELCRRLEALESRA